MAVLALSGTAIGQTEPSTVAPAPGSINAMVHEVAQGYSARATVAEHTGHALEAEVLYLRAVETDPGLLDAWMGYARTLDARQHRDEAVAVLSNVPLRARSTDRDVAELARALASLGRTDDALSMLRDRSDSAEAMHALADLAAASGRFPQALAAARRLAELSPEGTEGRQARVLVRALGQLVGEADAVRAVPATAPPLRRLLRGE